MGLSDGQVTYTNTKKMPNNFLNNMKSRTAEIELNPYCITQKGRLFMNYEVRLHSYQKIYK